MNPLDAIRILLEAMALQKKVTMGYITASYRYHVYEALCPAAIIFIGTAPYFHALKEGCALPRQFVVGRIQWLEIV